MVGVTAGGITTVTVGVTGGTTIVAGGAVVVGTGAFATVKAPDIQSLTTPEAEVALILQ